MITYIELEKISPNPWQTRMGISQEHIQELANDIAINGLLQTPVGRMVEEQVQLAFGHNRLAAFRQLATRGETIENGTISPWLKMPVDILMLSDEQMAQLAWSENERRRDVTPIERARAIRKRMDAFGWTQEAAAERLGLSRTAVGNIVRLLDLPENIQDELDEGNISERSAMALLPLYEVPEEIRKRQIDYWGGPGKIIEEALGGASSDAIRSKVNDYFERNFTSLHEKEVGLDQLFPEGGKIYCGLCRTCDKRISSRNVCLDRECYAAKVQFTRHKYLERASLASGYEIVDEEKGGYPSALSSDPARLERVLATKCKNLRLAYDLSGGDPKDPRRIPGHPKALLVCDKRNDSCTCMKGLDRMRSPISPVVERAFRGEYIPVEQMDDAIEDEDQPDPIQDDEPRFQPRVFENEIISSPAQVVVTGPTPAELEAVMRKARQDKRDAVNKYEEIQERLVEMMSQALADDQVGAFYVLINNYYFPRDNELDLGKVYRQGAKQIARHLMPQDYQSVNDMVIRINQKLEQLHLPEFRLEKNLVEVFAEDEVSTTLESF